MPKPIVWIPANASSRNPEYWFAPYSLCRTCIYQFLQEPYCDTVCRSRNLGIIQCDGYEREKKIDTSNPLPSYTIQRR